MDGTEKDGTVEFDTTFKTLGSRWQPSIDKFIFKSTSPRKVDKWTKRMVLSEIAKLYDPLGWLAPCVAKAKVLMQQLWRLSTSFDWDAPLPNTLIAEWQQIYIQLCLPIPIQVNRWIGLIGETDHIEIHGFCDASSQLYAAAVYIKTRHSNECVEVNLVAAKTKLAPIKTITIPRLELCGAVLLSQLLKRCTNTLSLETGEKFAWCDSKIVLAWLNSCPSRWSVFVVNRVSTIQQLFPSNIWQHVQSQDNPADIASRGALIADLAKNDLWWYGPKFIREPFLEIDASVGLSVENLPEQRAKVALFTKDDNELIQFLTQA